MQTINDNIFDLYKMVEEIRESIKAIDNKEKESEPKVLGTGNENT